MNEYKDKIPKDIADDVLETVKIFYEKGLPVVFAMDAHEVNDSHFILWPVHNVKGTWGQEMYGDLKPWYDAHSDDDNVFMVEKSEYDAFYETELAQILKLKGVDEVLVCGVCTDICVFNTVYGAYKEGLKTSVDRRLCATFTDRGDIFIDHMHDIYQTEII